MKSGVNHEENFPVASWLCPPHLRPVISAIYWFARTADDLADEGDAPPEQRLTDLAAFRAELALAASKATGDNANPPPFNARWAHVFVPLTQHIRAHKLPVHLLQDLLSAFEQDVRRTASGQRYANHAELLDYCRLSANPVGRLLLHLYGVDSPALLRCSDDVCSALQLINFWQDLSRDLPRQRHYLPLQELTDSGLTHDDFAQAAAGHPQKDGQAMENLVANLFHQSSATMQNGSKIALHIPGRAGWELRLVVQGGLRIADKGRSLSHRTWQTRPKLNAWDVPVLLWRAWRMG